jgi:hypothetical protein
VQHAGVVVGDLDNIQPGARHVGTCLLASMCCCSSWYAGQATGLQQWIPRSHCWRPRRFAGLDAAGVSRRRSFGRGSVRSTGSAR